MASELSKFDLAANSMGPPPCSRHLHGRSPDGELLYVELVKDICTIRSLNNRMECSYTLDEMSRLYPGFLSEVVSVGRWRSSCADRQCRICQLPDELRRKHAVEPGDVAVDSSSHVDPIEALVDANIPPVRHMPAPTPKPEPVEDDAPPSSPPRPRRPTTPPSESDESMDDISTTSYSPSPPPPPPRKKKSAIVFKEYQPRSRSRPSRRKTTNRKHTEYDKTIVAAKEIYSLENSQVTGTAKTLHEVIFDYITRSPPDRWIATIAILTNRSFKQVSLWFANRRANFDSRLLVDEDPRWHTYFQDVDFDLPDGSTIPMRSSALERWKSCRWTHEDFERVINEDFIPVIDVLEVEHKAKRETVPWYGHAKDRFPARVLKAQGVITKKKQRQTKG